MIRDGRKWQMRQALKEDIRRGDQDFWLVNDPKKGETGITQGMHTGEVIETYSSYQAGDEIYVRETWATNRRYNNLKPSELPEGANLWYKADGDRLGDQVGKWRSPIHMPEWAGRLILRVNAVRVEHLHDISLGDIEAEGCPVDCLPARCQDGGEAARRWWYITWGPISGNFDDNPVVIVYEFEVIG